MPTKFKTEEKHLVISNQHHKLIAIVRAQPEDQNQKAKNQKIKREREKERERKYL